MKQMFILLMVAMCATVFTACSKDGDTDPFDTGEGGVITMTTDEKDVYLYIGTAKVGEIITIDWGDGQTQEYRSVKEEENEKITFEVNAEHVYAQSGTHSIKVTGAVTKFRCTQYQLTALDISKCTTITELTCLDSEITSLDVSKNIALTRLDCRYSQLTELDVSKNIDLRILYCSSNDLTTLDVSNNTALTFLDCGATQLTALDISKNTALTEIQCDVNELSSTALNKIFTDLPKGRRWIDENGGTQQSYIDISNNPGSETCNKSIAENKGWKVVNR